VHIGQKANLMKRPLQLGLILLLAAPLVQAQELLLAERGARVVVAIGGQSMVQAQHQLLVHATPLAPEDLWDEADDHIALSVFPNPAVDRAVAHFQLSRSQQVTLDVFDLLGRRLGHRDLGLLSAGEHEANLDVRQLPPGIYIVRLSGDAGARATVRLIRSLSA
jgi:hypothetical protein